MKKKEWMITAVIVLAALAALLFMKFKPVTSSTPADPYANAQLPSQKAQGDWIAVVHRNRIILYFDSGVDAEYTVEGNVGQMQIEVKDCKWHVREVDCYDYTCKNMGWVSMDSLLPIICLPNDLVITDAATAANMITEASDGN